jgi:hypothetical protein
MSLERHHRHEHHRKHPLHITVPGRPTVETPFTAEEITTVPHEVIDGWVNGALGSYGPSEIAMIAEAIDETGDRLGFLGKHKGRKAAARLREQASERARITGGVTRKVQSIIDKSQAAQAESTQAAITKALADQQAALDKRDADKAAAEQAKSDKEKADKEAADKAEAQIKAAVQAAMATQAPAPGAPAAPGAVTLAPVAPLPAAAMPSFVEPPTAPVQIAPTYQARPSTLPPEMQDDEEQAPAPAQSQIQLRPSTLPPELQDDSEEGVSGYLGLLAAAAAAGPVSVEVKPSTALGIVPKVLIAGVAAYGGYYLYRRYQTTGKVF